MTSIFFILFLVMCGSGGGKASPGSRPKSNEDVWPLLGINLCAIIVHSPTREDCIKCFMDDVSDWEQAKDCVGEWLPPRFAKCVITSSSSQPIFEACLQKAKRAQNNEINRAKVLYKKGGKYMKMVADSNVVPDGGAAIFSCMAQELLVGIDSLQEELDKSSYDCFDRFQMDVSNEQWHLHKDDRPQSRKPHVVSKVANNKSNSRMDHLNERTLVYEYGYVGHDMPFHGIGPFAVDILKGECIFKTMENYGNLDMLVESAVTNNFPVPAWIFREMLNKITDITLPQ